MGSWICLLTTKVFSFSGNTPLSFRSKSEKKSPKMLLVATIASLTCVTLATPLYIGGRSTPGGSAICSAAESAYYGAKGEGMSNQLAGAIAGKVFYNKVFNVFDGSI